MKEMPEGTILGTLWVRLKFYGFVVQGLWRGLEFYASTEPLSAPTKKIHPNHMHNHEMWAFGSCKYRRGVDASFWSEGFQGFIVWRNGGSVAKVPALGLSALGP